MSCINLPSAELNLSHARSSLDPGEESSALPSPCLFLTGSAECHEVSPQAPSLQTRQAQCPQLLITGPHVYVIQIFCEVLNYNSSGFIDPELSTS